MCDSPAIDIKCKSFLARTDNGSVFRSVVGMDIHENEQMTSIITDVGTSSGHQSLSFFIKNHHPVIIPKPTYPPTNYHRGDCS